MKIEEFKQFPWLDPWHPTKPGLEKELAREVGPLHPLHGQQATAVGRRLDCDDVLFFLPEGPFPLAVVHLTWTGQREQKPEFPWTRFYADLQDWIDRCMMPDHAEIQKQKGLV